MYCVRRLDLMLDLSLDGLPLMRTPDSSLSMTAMPPSFKPYRSRKIFGMRICPFGPTLILSSGKCDLVRLGSYKSKPCYYSGAKRLRTPPQKSESSPQIRHHLAHSCRWTRGRSRSPGQGLDVLNKRCPRSRGSRWKHVATDFN